MKASHALRWKLRCLCQFCTLWEARKTQSSSFGLSILCRWTPKKSGLKASVIATHTNRNCLLHLRDTSIKLMLGGSQALYHHCLSNKHISAVAKSSTHWRQREPPRCWLHRALAEKAWTFLISRALDLSQHRLPHATALACCAEVRVRDWQPPPPPHGDEMGRFALFYIGSWPVAVNQPVRVPGESTWTPP